ncbi:hypothetical protein LEMLEM_LOCUS7370 [Lemmus lemmus]
MATTKAFRLSFVAVSACEYGVWRGAQSSWSCPEHCPQHGYRLLWEILKTGLPAVLPAVSRFLSPSAGRGLPVEGNSAVEAVTAPGEAGRFRAGNQRAIYNMEVEEWCGWC